MRSTSLVIESPEGRRHTVELRTERVSVGRANPTSNPDIVLEPDQWVSRIHCVLEFRAGAWYVSDNTTVNGTLLRRGDVTRRLTGDTRLSHGDTILILGASTGRETPDTGDSPTWTRTSPPRPPSPP